MRWNRLRKESDPFTDRRFGGMAPDQPTTESNPWVRRHRVATFVLTIVVLLSVSVGYATFRYFQLQGNLREGGPGALAEAGEGAPFNVLLVGSDSRGDLTPEQQLRLGAAAVPGQRADTVIFAHIDPTADRVTMIQFPRDLYVPIAGNGSNKINSALESGTKSLVTTVEQLTGVNVNHYAQVNIAGFRDIVDAIGGVKLCITEPIPFDPKTGLEITEEELPLVQFDGDRALRFVRSRAFPNGDFQRIQNQQKFLAAALNKVTSVGTLLDLGTINRLIDVAGDNVKIDQRLTIPGLYDIGQRMRSFDPSKYEAYTAPNLGITNNEAGSVILPDMPTLEKMFEAVAQNRSPAEADGVPDVDVATIDVGIYNGGAPEGAAHAAEVELEEATTVEGEHVEVVEVANWKRAGIGRTFIRFDPTAAGAREKAELVAAAVPDARMKEGPTPAGTDVAVIIGAAPFSAEKIVQIRPIPLPPPGTAPEGCRAR